MGTDVISQTQDGGEVEVDGKAGKRGHSRAGFLFFILVGQDALCHNCLTSLVMELVQRPYSIIPCLSGPTRFFIIFDGGLRWSRYDPVLFFTDRHSVPQNSFPLPT